MRLTIWQTMLSDLLEINIFPCRLLGIDLNVYHIGIGGTFAAEDAELHLIVFFSFGFDMHTAVSMVVFHEALDVVLHGVAVYVTPETDIKHATVNPNGISFHGCEVSVFS